MPVSRSRKKKNNHNNLHKSKVTSQTNLGELFNIQFNECRKCEDSRDEFAFKKLPDVQQSHWARSGIVNQ